MRGRSKNKLENSLLVIVFIGFCWTVYHYFLEDYIYTNYYDEKVNIKEVQKKYIENLNDIKITINKPKKEKTTLDTNETEQNHTTSTNLDINTTNTQITIYNYYTKLQKNFTKIVLDKTTDQNITKNTTIRLTILKDGNYEQIHRVSGDKKFYDMASAIIITKFPLSIPLQLQNKFPRYFKINIKDTDKTKDIKIQ